MQITDTIADLLTRIRTQIQQSMILLKFPLQTSRSQFVRFLLTKVM